MIKGILNISNRSKIKLLVGLVLFLLLVFSIRERTKGFTTNRYNIIVKQDQAEGRVASWDYKIESTTRVLCDQAGPYAKDAYVRNVQFNSTNRIIDGRLVGCTVATITMNESTPSEQVIWENFGEPENIIGVWLKTASNNVDLFSCTSRNCEAEFEFNHCDWTHIARYNKRSSNEIGHIIKRYPSGTYFWFQEATGDPIITCE